MADENEMIFNLISKPQTKHRKPARYRSKHAPTLPPTASTFGASASAQVKVTNCGGSLDGPVVKHGFKKPNATLGPLRVARAEPGHFMKKGAGNPRLEKPAKYTYQDARRPAVPKRTEVPVMGLVSTKNFVKTNALENILSKPPPEKAALAAAGERETSKTCDDFRHSEHARVPEYLKDVKEEIQAEYNFVKDMQKHRRESSSVKTSVQMLELGEKEDLLISLKRKWDEVNAAYQLCTHNTTLDTIGKIRRKETYESQLQQIEADITKLETQFVFVRQ